MLIDVGYPFLKNDEATTASAFELAQQYLGKENVEEMPARMTAEDFSHYSQVVPACFYPFIEPEILPKASPHRYIHQPLIDENCLKIGSGLMAWIAVNGLR